MSHPGLFRPPNGLIKGWKTEEISTNLNYISDLYRSDPIHIGGKHKNQIPIPIYSMFVEGLGEDFGETGLLDMITYQFGLIT